MQNVIKYVVVNFHNSFTRDIQINIPFPVKKIVFKQSSNDVANFATGNYLSSNIPGFPFLGFIGNGLINHDTETIFPNPQNINGMYTLSLQHVNPDVLAQVNSNLGLSLIFYE